MDYNQIMVAVCSIRAPLIYPDHPREPGGEAEEPHAEGGPEGKDSKPGLLGGRSSPLEQPPSWDLRIPYTGYI